jgi:hypothetical protein
MKGEIMKPQATKDKKDAVVALASEDIELDLEVLEEVIAPSVGPCYKK